MATGFSPPSSMPTDSALQLSTDSSNRIIGAAPAAVARGVGVAEAGARVPADATADFVRGHDPHGDARSSVSVDSARSGRREAEAAMRKAAQERRLYDLEIERQRAIVREARAREDYEKSSDHSRGFRSRHRDVMMSDPVPRDALSSGGQASSSPGPCGWG